MKLQTIEQHWRIIQQLHEQFWTTSDDYNVEEYARQEAYVNEGIFQMNERLEGLWITDGPKNNQNTVRSGDVKLPNIELPKFDGNYLNWRSYRDLFIDMVHNQEISECQKLWYLKSSLTGEAARLIQHVPSTSENYLVAWQIIEGRYENKRILASSLIQRLLTQQPVSKDIAVSIKALHDTTLECLLGIRALGMPTDNWDPLIVYILSQLLDKQTQMLWEQSMTNPREFPNLPELMKFLELRYQSLEVVNSNKMYFSSSHNSLIATIEACLACKNSHALYHCPKFLRMSNKQRLHLVQSAKGCVNCLKVDHQYTNCPSTKNCQKCHKRHHTLLHLNGKIKRNQPALESPTALITASEKEKSAVLLSTIILTVEDSHGQPVECRAILDSGSEIHLITQKLANKLGVLGTDHPLTIQGIDETQRNTSKRLNLHISSRITAFKCRIEAFVLPKIISPQPRQKVFLEDWKIPQNIQLADPQFNLSNEIDMLIGMGLFYSILSIGQIKLGPNKPILQNTLFGWIVGGKYPVTSKVDELSCGILTEEDFSSMEKVWETQECTTSSRPVATAYGTVQASITNTYQGQGSSSYQQSPVTSYQQHQANNAVQGATNSGNSAQNILVGGVNSDSANTNTNAHLSARYPIQRRNTNSSVNNTSGSNGGSSATADSSATAGSQAVNVGNNGTGSTSTAALANKSNSAASGGTGAGEMVHSIQMVSQHIQTGLLYYQQPVYSYKELQILPHVLPHVQQYDDRNYTSTGLGAGRNNLSSVAYSKMTPDHFTRTDNNSSPVSNVSSTMSKQAGSGGPLVYVAYYGDVMPGSFQYGAPAIYSQQIPAPNTASGGQFSKPSYNAGYRSTSYDSLTQASQDYTKVAYSSNVTQQAKPHNANNPAPTGRGPDGRVRIADVRTTSNTS